MGRAATGGSSSSGGLGLGGGRLNSMSSFGSASDADAASSDLAYPVSTIGASDHFRQQSSRSYLPHLFASETAGTAYPYLGQLRSSSFGYGPATAAAAGGGGSMNDLAPPLSPRPYGGGGGGGGGGSGSSGSNPIGGGNGWGVGISGSGSYTSVQPKKIVVSLVPEDEVVHQAVRSVLKRQMRRAAAALAAAKARSAARIEAVQEANEHAASARQEADDAAAAARDAHDRWEALVKERDDAVADETEKGERQWIERELYLRKEEERDIRRLKDEFERKEREEEEKEKLEKAEAEKASVAADAAAAAATASEGGKKRRLPEASSDGGAASVPAPVGASVDGGKASSLEAGTAAAPPPPTKRTRVDDAKEGEVDDALAKKADEEDSCGRTEEGEVTGASRAGVSSTLSAELGAVGVGAASTPKEGGSGGLDTPSYDSSKAHRLLEMPLGQKSNAADAASGGAPKADKKEMLASEKKAEDLEKIKSEVDGLNQTKSQMIWLLKQVITVEKSRKEELQRQKS